MKDLLKQFQAVREASRVIANLSDETRNAVLRDLAEILITNNSRIENENKKDLEKMPASDPRYDRLLLNQERIMRIAQDVLKITTLSSPIGQILLEKTLTNGLQLKKKSVPIGVVAVIYESRPNVTIDVFSLCFKAGNATILKGGKEASHTNQFLLKLIHQVLKQNMIMPESVYLLPVDREATTFLLNAVGLVDVCIPRGSQALIDFVRKHAKIPVIETGAGIVHTYFDESGDLNKGQRIIENAKTRRVSVCNALDTLVIHQSRLSDLPALVSLLANKKVELYADQKSYDVLEKSYPNKLLHLAKLEDFGIEFLDYKMSIKTVGSMTEAISHIQHYTSGHSEAIIAEDKTVTEHFLQAIDAAVVYANASTAFTDGGEFGMGAEIGISTQKLHARGPMGLDALTSYKWLIYGQGQTR